MLRQLHKSRLFFAAMLAIGLIPLTANVSLAQQPKVKAYDDVIKDVSVSFMIGVVAQPVSDTLRAQLPQLKGQGLEIRHIGTKSSAQKAGVQRYDILLKANKQTLKTTADLKKVVEQAGKDKKPVILELLRGGKQQTIQVKVVEGRYTDSRPIKVSEENLHLWGGAFRPADALLKVRTAATDKGFRIRIASTQDRKRFMITVSKNGKIVSKVTESTLDKLPADVKKDVQKMLQFSKQKQTKILPPSTTIINKDIPNFGSPASAYRHSPYTSAPGSPVPVYYRNSPTPAGINKPDPFVSRKKEMLNIDGYVITFVLEGSKPLQITLKKAENKLKTNTWSFKVKEIDKLPADIQKTAEKALKIYSEKKRIQNMRITPKDIEELRKLFVAKGVKLPASYHTLLKSQPNKQLTEMNKQIKALTAAIEKLNKKLDEK